MGYFIGQIISIIFHPIWSSVWLLLVFRWLNHPDVIRIPYQGFKGILLGFIGFSVVFPLLVVVWLLLSRRISSIFIQLQAERHGAYWATFIGLLFLGYWLQNLPLSPLFAVMTWAASFAIFIAAIVNYWWKISAHAIGIGGVFGGLLSQYALLDPKESLNVLLVILCLSGFIGMARLYLKSHSPAQWFCGWLLGFFNMFLIHFFI